MIGYDRIVQQGEIKFNLKEMSSIQYWAHYSNLILNSARLLSTIKVVLGLMVQKIRLVMHLRDEKYRLRAYSEFDAEFLKEIDKISYSKTKKPLNGVAFHEHKE